MKIFLKLFELVRAVLFSGSRVKVLVLLVLTPQLGLAREYSIAAPPAWVQRVSTDMGMQVPESELSDGVYFLLADDQVRLEGSAQQSFHHFVSRAINDKGLDEVASISIGFDPAYQSLTLHAINVIRRGQVIPKLKKATVRILQRETELEARIFDGRKTANVFLDDVRVGDIVEYSYTLGGSNPVFGGRHFGGVEMGWRVPVGRRYARLLAPNASPLKLVYHRTDLRPAERNQGALHEYIWDVRKLSSIPADGDSPGWYDPYPWIQWSEFGDWGDVARWAEPLYRTPANLSPALQAVVDRIAAASSDPAERLAAALQFVQREIRYLGVEIGVDSHAPSAPDLVFERRFGDCKDKTLLTVTLLRAMGIEAQPALVNTVTQRGIRDLQPNPGAFNHVIVRASLGDRHYWLDPARPPQSGAIKTISQPDFGLALLVNATTRELSSMESDPATRVRIKRTVAQFDSRKGLDQPLDFTVTTQVEGIAAESMRDALSSRNREEMQKRFLNFYADSYPGIELAAPFEVRDDPRSNRLEIIEHYRLKDFWVHNEEKKQLAATSYVPDMVSYLRRPGSTRRVDPLQVDHPVDITVKSVWLLPEDWSLKESDERVDDPAFSFENRLRLEDKGRKVVETDRFVSRADFVPAVDVQRYAANLDKARNVLGITLTKHDAVAETSQTLPSHSQLDRFNWSIAMLAVALLAVLSWLAHKAYRYDPAPFAGEIDPELRGLRGWLLLVAIGIAFQPLALLIHINQLTPAYAADTWMQLTTVGQAQYHALWAPVLLYELAVNLALLVFSVLLLVLFFKQRSSLPRVYVIYMGAALLLVLLDALLAGLIPAVEQMDEGPDSTWRQVVQRGVTLAIWGSYFMVSKRVKATFVNTWKKEDPKVLENDLG